MRAEAVPAFRILLFLSFAGSLPAIGPDVGKRLPDFSLPDQNGVTQSFESLKGPNGLMLVFYRSADW